MRQTKTVYSEEFCLTVVRKSDKKLSSLTMIAHQLGVSIQQVHQWCRQLQGH
jgi:transposase-like protein